MRQQKTIFAPLELQPCHTREYKYNVWHVLQEEQQHQPWIPKRVVYSHVIVCTVIINIPKKGTYLNNLFILNFNYVIKDISKHDTEQMLKHFIHPFAPFRLDDCVRCLHTCLLRRRRRQKEFHQLYRRRRRKNYKKRFCSCVVIFPMR